MRILITALLILYPLSACASDLTDAILGVDPTVRYKTGEGQALDRTYGPRIPSNAPAEDDLSYESSFGGFTSPLFDSPDGENRPIGPLFETDVPLLDEIPDSDYELLESEPDDNYDF